MEDKKIILNRIRTPDGTILTSYYRHDYQSYRDKNGCTYITDGGRDYLRRNVVSQDPKENMTICLPCEDLTVYSDAPFEIIRESWYRGGRGKNGDQDLAWVKLSEMNDSWLKACLDFDPIYQQELNYRKENDIKIEEEQ